MDLLLQNKNVSLVSTSESDTPAKEKSYARIGTLDLIKSLSLLEMVSLFMLNIMAVLMVSYCQVLDLLDSFVNFLCGKGIECGFTHGREKC